MPCLLETNPSRQRMLNASRTVARLTPNRRHNSSSEGSLRSGPHCVRANSRIASFTSTYRGSRCSLTRLTSDDFSITHPMWPVNVFPLRKIRRKADISSSRFCGKGCHAIPRGSSCARYVSKATKEMASGLPPVVPSGICRSVRLFSKDGVPLLWSLTIFQRHVSWYNWMKESFTLFQ